MKMKNQMKLVSYAIISVILLQSVYSNCEASGRDFYNLRQQDYGKSVGSNWNILNAGQGPNCYLDFANGNPHLYWHLVGYTGWDRYSDCVNDTHMVIPICVNQYPDANTMIIQCNDGCRYDGNYGDPFCHELEYAQSPYYPADKICLNMESVPNEAPLDWYNRPEGAACMETESDVCSPELYCKVQQGNPGDIDPMIGSCTPSECGDSIINGLEVCEKGNLSTCKTDLGYDGIHICNGTCDGWDICITNQSCGDGIINGNEQCEGNSGVGPHQECDSDCKIVNLPFCGNYIVDQVSEECDRNVTRNGSWLHNPLACSSECKLQSYCGDGIVDDNEECDDGNWILDDNCTNSCHLPICGDNIKQADEVCDGSYGLDYLHICNENCTLITTLPHCGDGLITGGEQCDNGSRNGEVCSPNYNSECSHCDYNCVKWTNYGAFCGDNLKNGIEQCDGTDGVGLHQSCGTECTLISLPYCGDSVKNNNEECDDGNQNDLDICRNNCTLTYCGDGYKTLDEECDGKDGIGVTEICTSHCRLKNLTIIFDADIANMHNIDSFHIPEPWYTWRTGTEYPGSIYTGDNDGHYLQLDSNANIAVHFLTQNCTSDPKVHIEWYGHAANPNNAFRAYYSDTIPFHWNLFASSRIPDWHSDWDIVDEILPRNSYNVLQIRFYAEQITTHGRIRSLVVSCETQDPNPPPEPPSHGVPEFGLFGTIMVVSILGMFLLYKRG
jgi:cysteine-rich repeat protein